MNIEELKAAFDKVVLKHHKDCENPRSVAALVNGDHVYIGIAKCFETDQFNRRVGRTIALGRAVHAFNRTNKHTPIRQREAKRILKGDPLSLVLKAGEDISVDDILKSKVFT